MKPSEIPNHLAQINFILAPHRDKTYHVDSDKAQSFYYPDYAISNTDCVMFLINIAKYYKDRKVVIHTFNDVFINTISFWIRSGKLPVDYVKIFIIEENEVRICTYDKDGVLENWPVGWFSTDIEVVENANLG